MFRMEIGGNRRLVCQKSGTGMSEIMPVPRKLNYIILTGRDTWSPAFCLFFPDRDPDLAGIGLVHRAFFILARVVIILHAVARSKLVVADRGEPLGENAGVCIL